MGELLLVWFQVVSGGLAPRSQSKTLPAFSISGLAFMTLLPSTVLKFLMETSQLRRLSPVLGRRIGLGTLDTAPTGRAEASAGVVTGGMDSCTTSAKRHVNVFSHCCLDTPVLRSLNDGSNAVHKKQRASCSPAACV